ncbi:right-handed parallel beta-helix repeat-containing protein, partial [Bacteroidales bacterium OttesenSCG-928-A14]|nr:right-handed parallel beta-helix repeat-containing protein [Bacteroidales bacterium OttesenSCG-928-A14]
VYGGFFGDETSIADRPKSDLDGNGTIEPWEFTHATVLDGQHTRQVLNQAADFSIETVWDGVTIANGRVLGGVFGGGAYIRANCQLINSIIKNNVSASSNPNNALRAGGIYNKGGGIKKCIIYDNIIDDNQNYGASAGGVYNEEGTIDSCTIYNNSISHTHTYPSSYSGAGIYNKGGTVGNSIISNNKVIGGFIVHGVGIYNSDNGTINNCKIRENIVSDVVYSYGGGIYSHEGGTISNCEVISNFSALQGGGIFMNNGGVIENSTISGNTISVSQHAISFTPSGAGIYSDGAIIRNCTINENRLSYTYASANQSVCGGGLYIRGEGGAVSHCTVIGNTVSYSANTVNFARGGGIYCYETMTEIVDCIVKNNKTLINGDIDGQGGGVYQGVITRCRIEDNSSGEGGGFYKSSVNNCIVFNNSATSHGGGGFLEENGKSVNCTFINNTAAGRGGGIYVNASTNTSVANSVFWQNYAPFWEQIGTPAGASAANVTYSAVQEQYPGAGNIVIAEDNDNGGPLFFNPATHNWQLQEGSPCINAGSNVALSATDTIDLAGNPRVFDATVDMGAYERQGANPPTHTISGQVTCGGNPLEGVIITSDSSIVTDALGMYSMTVCQGTNIVITPTMEGYGFIPQSIACDNVMGNLENRNFTAITMIPVTHITNVPDTVLPNVPYLLNGTVEPSDATKQAIVWSVADAGTAGATIAGDTLNTAGIGTLVITATIIDGITLGVNYVQHFTIATALNFFCGGNGTPTDPYQICTHQQLNTLAVYVNAGNGDATEDKYYKLMSDIDLSSYDNWTPIGNNSTNNNTHRFQGYFDGNKKVVRNLTISDSSNYQGLFGYATGGAIQNLGIENCAINGNQYVGGLVGYSATDISNCYITGNVSGRGDYVGGLTGYGTSAISDCYATANVSGNAHVGGLMGFNSSTLSNSYAAANPIACPFYMTGGITTADCRLVASSY